MTTVCNMTEIIGESVIYVETQGVVVRIEAETAPKSVPANCNEICNETTH
ncbi:hypothetical protein [Aliiruegeria sabulilitoris]|nr:hypothetical protein [Aliiruegeria sabulilitoris]